MRCPSGTTSGTGRGRSRSSPWPSRTDAGRWRPSSPTRPGPLRTRETWRSSPRRSGPRWSRPSSPAPPPDSRSPSYMSTQAASPDAAGLRWAPTPPYSVSRPPESPSQCSVAATIWRQCSAAPRAWWLMGRSALLALLPALLITTGWQTLEEPVRGGGGPRGRRGGPPAALAADGRDPGLGRGRRLVRLRRLAARGPAVRRRARLPRSRPERVQGRPRRLLRGLVALQPRRASAHARGGRARRLRVHARRHAGDHGAPTDPCRRYDVRRRRLAGHARAGGRVDPSRRPHSRRGAPAPGGAAPGGEAGVEPGAARGCRGRVRSARRCQLAVRGQGRLPRLAAVGAVQA